MIQIDTKEEIVVIVSEIVIISIINIFGIINYYCFYISRISSNNEIKELNNCNQNS